MFAVLKKELKSYFLSPIGYVFIGLFLLMTSVFFYLDILSYGMSKFQNMFYSLATILTFITPILTMRMFSEEKKEGTDQLLFTSPRGITSIVFGKFLAAICVLLITELLTFIYYFILMYFGKPDFVSSIVTLGGFLLLGAAYISFGMFASSITENQVVAAILTVGFFILTWFLPDINEIFSSLSLINMFDKFPSGQIALSEIVTFISFTLLFVALTIIVLQRRKSVK